MDIVSSDILANLKRSFFVFLKISESKGRRDPLNRGVWVNGEKIASVGVAIKRWVSFHGLSLNYETDLKYFELINPCGLEGKKMTSMGKILGTEIFREQLVERICFHFKQIFERDWAGKGFIGDIRFRLLSFEMLKHKDPKTQGRNKHGF